MSNPLWTVIFLTLVGSTITSLGGLVNGSFKTFSIAGLIALAIYVAFC